jgi:hypothetical protein
MSCELCGKPFPKGKDLNDMADEGWSFFTIGTPKRYDAAICPDHSPAEAVLVICRDILGWKVIRNE